jgi:hypothetical protein
MNFTENGLGLRKSNYEGETIDIHMYVLSMGATWTSISLSVYL